MSDLANYAFLPWMRRGISTEITRVDGSGPTAPRASARLTVEVRANEAPTERDVQVDLALFGPGEVAGIDRRMVIRTVPPAGSHDVEPNYFPAVEFHQPDFPWRYTPARATNKGRLRPWLVLVVVTQDEVADRAGPGNDGRLPSIAISAEVLPDLSQAWAWAHVAVSGVSDAASETVQNIADEQPDRALSRLLCARRLEPTTKYHAVIVPAFERGRLAGLRKPVPEELDALQPAWTGSGQVELPVYYEWQFETGVAGDFEFLVRKLRARALAEGVGSRDMDARTPDPALPMASAQPMGLEGALMSPATTTTPWPAAEREPFVSGLKTLVDRPADLLQDGSPTRIVAPPLYGSTYTRRERLEPGSSDPRWFHELNADPRHRVGAGLGTTVVQEHQEELMAAAWEKVEGILALNEKLRRAQVARELATSIHERHLARLPEATMVEVATPFHRRLRAAPAMAARSGAAIGSTIQKIVGMSPIAAGGTTAAFRRVMRSRGPVRVRQRRFGSNPEAPVLERMNSGEVAAAPDPRGVDVGVTPGVAGASLAPTWFDERIDDALGVVLWLMLVLTLVVLVIAIVLQMSGLPLATAFWVMTGVVAAATGAAAAWTRRTRLGSAVRDETLDGDAVRGAYVGPAFAPALITPGSSVPVPTTPSAGATARLRDAMSTMLDEFTAAPAAGPVLVPLNMTSLRSDLLARLHPSVTVRAALAGRMRLPEGLPWRHEDPLEPVMAAPEFERPMYEPLRDLSQDWLMPGVDEIPQNTITLAVTNQRFIEAYMLGLNHEMGRELVWREYPTDRRGTYFRQFWDVRGYSGSATTESLKDIEPIHGWSRLELGEHSSRTPPPGGEHLVLMIKGEVLRRYPGTVVYAVRAELGEDGKRTLTSDELHPVFEGRLHPDVAFFGFELTAEQVHGDPDPEADQGWFFMLQEQPTQPRFGLDIGADVTFGAAVGDYDDLSWKHLVTSAEELATLSYVDLDANLPNTSSITFDPSEPAVVWHADAGIGPKGSTAADIAYITLQRPFRVAVHGSDMLPET